MTFQESDEDEDDDAEDGRGLNLATRRRFLSVIHWRRYGRNSSRKL